MAERKRFDSGALQYLWDRSTGRDPKRIAEFEQNLVNMEVAQRIYDLRTKAGLSQRELAKKVGTTASAICRLEDADYEGHSLTMMKRIAAALDNRVEIRFVPIRKRAQAGNPGIKRKAG